MAENPLTLKNGIWAINKRKELWLELGPKIFDSHLETFRACAVKVLAERDPKFELDSEERYAASIYGKSLKHSRVLRKGIAESLALMGSNPQIFTKCSSKKPETIAILTIQKILEDADWVAWASLGNLLPLLAEAAPDKFLNSVELALNKEPCPIDTLFLQEGNGLTGGNYLSGILWALETLAWDEEYLVRVTVLLGDLASRDPGGTWANRPADSLSTIFLPWLPQTRATSEKMVIAVKTLTAETPEVGWKLLLSLLPDTHQSSMGSHKPKFRESIPDDWKTKVTNKEYWDQIAKYAELAVEMAQNNIAKLNELIKHLDRLPQESFEKTLEHIGSQNIIHLPEIERITLWTELKKFICKHKKYADAKWALPSDLVLKIENVAMNLTPENPVNLYRRLFDESDVGLFEEKGDWKEQRIKLQGLRQKAVEEIFNYGEIMEVLRFAENVKSSYSVGYSLGFIEKPNIDSIVLSKYLESEDNARRDFSRGFIWGRFQSKGWHWVDNIDKKTWSKPQIGKFLAILPFTEDTWNRAKSLLKKNEIEYWSRADVIPCPSKNKLKSAIDKLIAYNRPDAAIHCLYALLHEKQPLEGEQAIKALLATVSLQKPANQMEVYWIKKIIAALQDDPKTNQDSLLKIEWAYLPLLTSLTRETSPITLEHRLASDPKFFCEIIRLAYRSKKEKTSKTQPTEKEKSLASNAHKLLCKWEKTPGSQPDGSISGKGFTDWIKTVKTESSKSGHLDVAMSRIGNALIHCPPDPNGLWVHCAIAKELNAKDASRMRDGFLFGTLNSRGAHCVDPTGKPEKELAKKFKKQAKEVENAGYHRFAVTIKEIAQNYEFEAQQIIDEHAMRKE